MSENNEEKKEIRYRWISPLKFYTQHILPLVYDDSLSYLEMLGKVRHKLNELINYYNKIKDLVPKALEGEIEKIQAEIDARLADAIADLNNQLTADITDLNAAKAEALDDIADSVAADKAALTAWATTEVQRIIAEYDSALAPLLNPSATAVALAAGSPPTASYSNGVFTFGLPANQGDMTVAQYGGSAPGTVAQADNALALGGIGASGYMQKTVYDTNNNGIVDQAENATNAANLGGIPASGYMEKTTYDANNNGIVDQAESAELADDSEMLGGQLPSYYATAANMTDALARIAALEQTSAQPFVYEDIEDEIAQGYYWKLRKFETESGDRFEAWIEFQCTLDSTNGIAYNPMFISPLTTVARFPYANATIDQQFVSISSTLNNVFAWTGYVNRLNDDQQRTVNVRAVNAGYAMSYTAFISIYLTGFIPNT